MYHVARAFLWVVLGWTALLALGCQPPPGPEAEDDRAYFARQDSLYGGDYLASYPLHNPDSCILRLQAEVPASLQPWACLSLWYRLPRDNPARSFRLLELYDTHYPHDTVKAFTQMMRGEFMAELQQHDSARLFLADARNRYLRLNRPLDASDADYLQARCYLQENNQPRALEIYHRVLELLNQHDTTFSHRHAFLYIDMATAYRHDKNYPTEIYWLNQAWQADHSHLDKAWDYQIKIATRMASSYARINPDSSLIMAQRAVDIFKENVDGPVPAKLQYYLGLAHLRKGQCTQALSLHLDAHRQRPPKPDDLPEARFWSSQIVQAVGESYYCLGQTDSAEFYLRQATATPDTGNLVAVYRRLAETNAQRGHFSEAYAQLSWASALHQRLYAVERATALSEFEVRYQTAEKERRIAALEAEGQITRQRYLIVTLLILAILGALLAIFLRQRAQRHILEQQNQLLAQEKELAETRAQLKAQELELSQISLHHTRAELHGANHLLNLKNQLIDELQLRLKTIPASSDAPSPDSFLGAVKILTEDDWRSFRRRFDEQVPGLIDSLHVSFPNLTNAEIRLFLLVKLGFDSLEISGALGISKDSVYRSRHRLSKKLGLTATNDLDGFVRQF